MPRIIAALLACLLVCPPTPATTFSVEQGLTIVHRNIETVSRQALAAEELVAARCPLEPRGALFKSGIVLDLPLAPKRVHELVQDRVRAPRQDPLLVEPEAVKARHFFKRFEHLDAKAQFRQSLLMGLADRWTQRYGPEKSNALIELGSGVTPFHAFQFILWDIALCPSRSHQLLGRV